MDLKNFLFYFFFIIRKIKVQASFDINFENIGIEIQARNRDNI